MNIGVLNVQRCNKLNIYDTKRIVKIYENKTIYRFYIFDLLKYWKTLLLNSEYLYEDPLTLKNYIKCYQY